MTVVFHNTFSMSFLKIFHTHGLNFPSPKLVEYPHMEYPHMEYPHVEYSHVGSLPVFHFIHLLPSSFSRVHFFPCLPLFLLGVY